MIILPKNICLLPNILKINICVTCACYTNKSLSLTTDYTQLDKKSKWQLYLTIFIFPKYLSKQTSVNKISKKNLNCKKDGDFNIFCLVVYHKQIYLWSTTTLLSRLVSIWIFMLHDVSLWNELVRCKNGKFWFQNIHNSFLSFFTNSE